MTIRNLRNSLGAALALIRRFAPAAVLFSAFVFAEGGLKWIGVLGFVPLAVALIEPRCACGGRSPTEVALRVM